MRQLLSQVDLLEVSTVPVYFLAVVGVLHSVTLRQINKIGHTTHGSMRGYYLQELLEVTVLLCMNSKGPVLQKHGEYKPTSLSFNKELLFQEALFIYALLFQYVFSCFLKVLSVGNS